MTLLFSYYLAVYLCGQLQLNLQDLWDCLEDKFVTRILSEFSIRYSRFFMIIKTHNLRIKEAQAYCYVYHKSLARFCMNSNKNQLACMNSVQRAKCFVFLLTLCMGVSAPFMDTLKL